MKKDIKNQILELAQSMFDEDDYEKVVNYLKKERLNDLRLFIADKMEMCEDICMLTIEDENLKNQVKLLNELENIILEEFLENVE